MTAGRAHAGGESRFAGRNAEMAAGLDAAAHRPRHLVVAGATRVGTTRFATELARALADDAIATIRVRSASSLADRLSRALPAAELRFDPVEAAEAAPASAPVAHMDDGGVEQALAIGKALDGTGALPIGCAAHAPAGAAGVSVEQLDDARARLRSQTDGQFNRSELSTNFHAARTNPATDHEEAV